MTPRTIPHDWHGQYPLTDISRWRLEDKPDGLGDHNWNYVSEAEAKKSKQRVMEKYWLGQPVVSGQSSHIVISFMVSDAIILFLYSMRLLSPVRQTLGRRHETATLSTSPFKLQMVIGLENTAVHTS